RSIAERTVASTAAACDDSAGDCIGAARRRRNRVVNGRRQRIKRSSGTDRSDGCVSVEEIGNRRLFEQCDARHVRVLIALVGPAEAAAEAGHYDVIYLRCCWRCVRRPAAIASRNAGSPSLRFAPITTLHGSSLQPLILTVTSVYAELPCAVVAPTTSSDGS